PVVSISAGYRFSLALDAQGRVWSWGDNSRAQLGNGNRESSSIPVPVDLSPLGGATVVDVRAGDAYTEDVLAIDDLGRLWIWGGSQMVYVSRGKYEGDYLPVLVGDLAAQPAIINVDHPTTPVRVFPDSSEVYAGTLHINNNSFSTH